MFACIGPKKSLPYPHTQYTEVPASFYRCPDDTKPRAHLDLLGVTTLEPEGLKQLITPALVAKVVEFAELMGAPIFNEAMRTGEGKVPKDSNDEGRYLLTSGEGGLRWQAHLSKPQKPAPGPGEGVHIEAGRGGSDEAEEEMGGGGNGEQEEGEEEENGQEEGGGVDAEERRFTREKWERACELLEGIAPVRQRITQALESAKAGGEKVQKGVVLINRPGSPPLRAQLIHTDMSVGRKGFVAIAVLEPCSVLVSPGSHSAIRQYQGLLGIDKQLHKAREANALASVAVSKLVRMQMEPGQVVLLHGNTVHAGDAAVGDRKSPRLHFYVLKGNVDNETNPLFHLGKRFAAMFV